MTFASTSQRIALVTTILAAFTACATSADDGGPIAPRDSSTSNGDAPSGEGGDDTATTDLDTASGDDSTLSLDTGSVSDDTGSAPIDTGSASDDTGAPPADTGSTGDDSSLVDSAPVDSAPVDTGVVDSPGDTPIGTPVTVRQMANASDPLHPAAKTQITNVEALVALSPRVLLSGPGTNAKCTWGLWVGTPAGGDFSGIQLVETVAATGSPASCPTTGAVGVIPDTAAVGDRITGFTGQFDDFCPSTSGPCPTNAAAEVHMISTDKLTLIAGGGAVPAPTTVTIASITASGATPAARDLALQNTLVRLTNTVVQQQPTSGAPPAGNFDTMLVSATGTSTPTMPVVVKSFTGVTCVRGKLVKGFASGTITGLLSFEFGQWVIHLRSKTDVSGATGC